MLGSTNLRKRSWAWTRVFSAALLLLLLAQLVSLLWLIWNHTPLVPTLDEWEMANFLELADQGRLDLFTFWGFQNEHRIFLPRLILYALINLTGWQRQIIMTVNLGIAIITAMFICAAARRTLGTSTFIAISMPLLMLLFSFAQYENWLFAFQTNFLLAACGIACCLYGLTAQTPGYALGRSGLILAFGGAIVASLSTLAGLLSWPAFLLAIWRFGRWQTALWCASATAIIIPYFIGFPKSTTTVAQSRELLEYALTYLGAPLGFPTVGLAMTYGGLGLVLMALAIGILWRLEVSLSTIMPWLTLGLYALAGMALTTLGRAGFGREQALTSRYQLFSSLWWISLLVVSAFVVRLRRQRHGRAMASSGLAWHATVTIAVLVTSILFVGLLRANALGFVEAQEWQSEQIAHKDCALHYNTAPDDCLRYFYVSAPIVRIHLAFLEQHQFNIFRGQSPDLERLPDNHSALAIIDTVARQPGDSRALVVNGDQPIQVAGWALDRVAAAPVAAVYLLIDDRYTYRTSYGSDRPDVAATLSLPAVSRVGFTATLPAGIFTPGKHTLNVRTVTADGRARADGTQPIVIEVR